MKLEDEFFERFSVAYAKQLDEVVINATIDLFKALYPLEMEEAQEQMKQSIVLHLLVFRQSQVSFPDYETLKQYLLEPLRRELFDEETERLLSDEDGFFD